MEQSPNTNGAASAPWTSAQRRAQYTAIAWLRWRIFRNGFRRKGAAGDMAATLVLTPLLGLLVLGLAAGGFVLSMSAAQKDDFRVLTMTLWGLFLVCQLLNINLGQPGTTFDPTQLIRFPLRLGDYVLVRFFFGVLTPANVVVCTTSLAIAAGLIYGNSALWLPALLAMGVFAAVNLIFSRMVFSWVDRWLSTRRAREIFTAAIFAVSIGIQYANFAYSPAYHNHHTVNAAKTAAFIAVLNRVSPYARFLPPELASHGVAAAARGAARLAAAAIAGCAAYGLLFLAIFAMRMRTEYHGENLSDQAAGPVPLKKSATPARARVAPSAAALSPSAGAPALNGHAHPAAAEGAPPPPRTAALLPTLLQKEFIYLRRNFGLLYGLVAPLLLVFIFTGKNSALGHHQQWVFPAALAYGLLGVVPVSFNSLGLDGEGAQMYFITPVSLRDIFLAKNIFNIALAALEVAVIWAVLTLTSHGPTALMALNALLWLGATIFLELTVGNYRTLSSPKKINPGRSAQKQASPLSALLAMAILFVSAVAAYGLQTGAAYVGLPWLAPLVLAILLVVAAWGYWTNLARLDLYAFNRREALFAELSKKA